MVTPARALVLLAIAAVGVYSFTHLGLAANDLLPGNGLLPRARDLRTLGEFVSRAATPAFDYESIYGRENAPPLIWKATVTWKSLSVYVRSSSTIASSCRPSSRRVCPRNQRVTANSSSRWTSP